MEDYLFDPIEYLIRHPYMNYLDIREKVEKYKVLLYYANYLDKDTSYLINMLEMLRSVRTMIWVRQFALKDMSQSGYKHVYETRFLGLKEPDCVTNDLTLLKHSFVQYNMYKHCLNYSSERIYWVCSSQDEENSHTQNEQTDCAGLSKSNTEEWKDPTYINNVKQKIIEDNVKDLIEKVALNHKQKFSENDDFEESMTREFQSSEKEHFDARSKDECLMIILDSKRTKNVDSHKDTWICEKDFVSKSRSQVYIKDDKHEDEGSLKYVPKRKIKTLPDKILDLLSDGKPRKAIDIASILLANKREINRRLYSDLKGKVWCDSQYKWHIKQ